MANKKQKAAQKKRQAQHRQSHNVEKSHDRDQHREHLPKTGTNADHDYLMRRSREDLLDFGLTESKGKGPLIVIGILVVLALIGLFVLLVIY